MMPTIEFDRSFFAAVFLIFTPLIVCAVVARKAKTRLVRRIAGFAFFFWMAAWIIVFLWVPVLR